ncbi:hypothetical protein V2A60_009645 [Cordyceps javanica]|uniref:Uncharacterized protein n=1 Tax=Cordyceps javanica TaxID=43265 RepID=A0A545VUY9_9HYPO|nr:hypothetical protein IF1G_06307 [Cordyceps javanica]TQW05484.1 hypothetical protein IF2G_06606 [Cordyceps javanica]
MSPEPCSRENSDTAEQLRSVYEADGSVFSPVARTVPERRPRHLLTRLPPAPPLTPPELSTSIFACEEDVDGFISQPNPDYLSATSSIPLQNPQPTRQSRSFMKTVTMGAPRPYDNQDAACPDRACSPIFAQGPGTQDQVRGQDDETLRRNVNVQGQIISLVNENGQGWTRHTRVYGGGVCLACASSGGHEGGFYGATVTPEEMRY